MCFEFHQNYIILIAKQLKSHYLVTPLRVTGLSNHIGKQHIMSLLESCLRNRTSCTNLPLKEPGSVTSITVQLMYLEDII